jgi:DNA-binding response OmpR family regulator
MQLHPLAGRRLVIIKDDLASALPLPAELERTGAEVSCVTPRDALELIAHGKISAAVVELQPDSGETRALVRLLGHRHVPFLIHSEEPPPHVTTGRGAPFIAKPCPPQKIIAAITFLVRERRRKYARTACLK